MKNMPDAAQTFKAGDLIQDTYRIDTLLGEGGMGATYRGTNLATGDTVAIKVMTSDFAKAPKSFDLFKRESRLLRTVQSDAVIRYETTLQDKAGRLFLIMEFLQGRPLSDYLARKATLRADDVLKLGIRLAKGLNAIHALGIVHRDIAPDNIMIPDDDVMKAKLIDFGLASDTTGTEKSIIGDSFAGKFSFSAPEQFGLHGGKIGPGTDIYSLGLVLLKVAGITVPGEGAGIGVIEHRRGDLILSNDGTLPVKMLKAIEQMLKVNPEHRPKDPVALLTNALSSNETLLAFETADGQLGSTLKHVNHPKTALTAAGVISVLIAAGAIVFFFWPNVNPISGVDKSRTQSTVAKEATQAQDPLMELTGLIDKGGETNLNAAFGGLMTLGRDESQNIAERQNAYIMLAQMFDPTTFNPARSPFREPDTRAARRYYQSAADLGSDLAKMALLGLME
jgi:serine/threonine protein kinase